MNSDPLIAEPLVATHTDAPFGRKTPRQRLASPRTAPLNPARNLRTTALQHGTTVDFRWRFGVPPTSHGVAVENVSIAFASALLLFRVWRRGLFHSLVRKVE